MSGKRNVSVCRGHDLANALYSASNLLGALLVCDEHRGEVLEFVHILQGLTITQDSAAHQG